MRLKRKLTSSTPVDILIVVVIVSVVVGRGLSSRAGGPGRVGLHRGRRLLGPKTVQKCESRFQDM